MSFSVSHQGEKSEWGFSGLSALFAEKTRVFSPAFYRMMWDLIHFNHYCTNLLKLDDDDPRKQVSLGEFLDQNGYSRAFQEDYLLPITSSLWSSSSSDVRRFSAVNCISFLHNHKMLQLFTRPEWLTCTNRSQEYVDLIVAELKGRLELENAVVTVSKSSEMNGGGGWQVCDMHGEVKVFDKVLFACPADTALQLLGSSILEEERLVLEAFKFSENILYLHTDESLMPKRKAVWSSWNYIKSPDKDRISEKWRNKVFITYWLNSLENLKCKTNVFVSLNPTSPPQPSKTHLVKAMRHPQFTPEGERAQAKIRDLNGKRGAYFAGAWMGYGFHEDGLLAGLEAATHMTGTPVPWVQKDTSSSKDLGTVKLVEPRPVIRELPVCFLDPLRPFRKIIRYMVEGFTFRCIQGFMQRGITKGYITLKLPNGRTVSYGDQSYENTEFHSIIKVFDWNFFTRVALEYDLGFSKSYMAGEIILEGKEGDKTGDSLARFFHVLCLNRGYKGNASNTLYAGRQLVTSLIGSTLNWLYLRLSLDNSISGSHSNISAHYDLSNDLFATFLDTEMVYSSAIYDAVLDDSGVVQFRGSLEDAEIRKIDTLLNRCNIHQEHHLLDIGFGWGGICIRAAMRFGCRVTGITLSIEQKEEAERRVREKGLSNLISFHLVDYRLFARENPKKFDRIVSCEMIEAVGYNYLGSYFAAVDRLLRPNGIFVMEAITTPEVRYQEYLKSTDFISSVIFPGSHCPSLTALMSAMEKNSALSLEAFDNIGLHYAQTLREWRYR